jgi:hypothetical protein
MSRTLFERAERSVVESGSGRGRVHGQSGLTIIDFGCLLLTLAV